MKDDDVLPVSTPTSSLLSSKKDHSSDISAFFRRGRYKFWALAAILLLAFWSMLTGTVTLRWSAGDLNRAGEDFSSAAAEDLDVLDLEDRVKLVEHMWDVYTNSHRIGLGGFWQEAFVAAYEDLTSEVPDVKLAAVSEIARMSVGYVPPQDSSSFSPVQGTNEHNPPNVAITAAIDIMAPNSVFHQMTVLTRLISRIDLNLNRVVTGQ